MNQNKYKLFVKTYNTLSSTIQDLINNNDMEHRTNRRYIAGKLMEELAKKGLLNEEVNNIDFDTIYWDIDHLVGHKMKSFDGDTVEWFKNKD